VAESTFSVEIPIKALTEHFDFVTGIGHPAGEMFIECPNTPMPSREETLG
jgi:hypothetical protein